MPQLYLYCVIVFVVAVVAGDAGKSSSYFAWGLCFDLIMSVPDIKPCCAFYLVSLLLFNSFTLE